MKIIGVLNCNFRLFVAILFVLSLVKGHMAYSEVGLVELLEKTVDQVNPFIVTEIESQILENSREFLHPNLLFIQFEELNTHFQGWDEFLLRVNSLNETDEPGKKKETQHFQAFSANIALAMKLTGNGYHEIAEWYFASAIIHLFYAERDLVRWLTSDKDKKKLEKMTHTLFEFLMGQYSGLSFEIQQKIKTHLSRLQEQSSSQVSYQVIDEKVKAILKNLNILNDGSISSTNSIEISSSFFIISYTAIKATELSLDFVLDPGIRNEFVLLAKTLWVTINTFVAGGAARYALVNALRWRHRAGVEAVVNEYKSKCEYWLSSNEAHPR